VIRLANGQEVPEGFIPPGNPSKSDIQKSLKARQILFRKMGAKLPLWDRKRVFYFNLADQAEQKLRDLE